jgi:transketolase
MPCWSLFEQQPKSYRDAVLPPSVRARVAVEQAGALGWDRYVGPDGATLTMSTFGASAPFAKLKKRFGFTIPNLVKLARGVMIAERT